MVTLSRIYTRTGDHGSTRLADGSTTTKTGPRVEAYGSVDAANTTIGLALALDDQILPERVHRVLRLIQNELFDVGSDLASPLVSRPRFEPVRMEQRSIDRLEAWCDEFGGPLPTLHSFILPGGNPVGAQLHVARTAVRSAERAAWRAVEAYGTEVVDSVETDDSGQGGVDELAITYLNRLSDLLFILARVANRADDPGEGNGDEVLWIPAGHRDEE
ncbi:ATP:cob(I)alamin adenosyltransferase [Acidipropionibacterium jensenii]|uniref:Corrinoid adenosyltransferase n=1 Tax=Acidipropionibacterium jensenii TaxID=1749 RepID=A0A3T0RX96_9ACTN|nr:cob(I)yrinic acid a,c-diamide adenosyltransferase [Acidipropionibacterium jensenii]AZZ38624.1 ATP:cob(I)alamin adenosyltransferase [Acidipropionibacterium jensenii]